VITDFWLLLFAESLSRTPRPRPLKKKKKNVEESEETTTTTTTTRFTKKPVLKSKLKNKRYPHRKIKGIHTEKTNFRILKC
jgi:hypothetical protein